MIIQLRLDERLIHGQVVTAWSRALPINTIVCASDKAVKDSLRTKMLLMAAPPGIRVRVRGVDDTIKLLSDPRADKMEILLITDTPQNAKRLVDGLKIKDVNIANYHSGDKQNDIAIHDCCSVNKEDLKAFRELADSCDNIFTQMLPSVEKRNFKELLRNAKD